MNIFFGDNLVNEAKQKYTILELDTFVLPNRDETVTAYCAVDMIPLQEMPQLESMVALHHNMMIEYRKRNWKYCEDALEHLVGKWRGELDTFYDAFGRRIKELKTQTLADDWSGAILAPKPVESTSI